MSEGKGYTSHLYSARYECYFCEVQWILRNVAENQWDYCPRCGVDYPPVELERNINAWSLTPRGERLGPSESS